MMRDFMHTVDDPFLEMDMARWESKGLDIRAAWKQASERASNSDVHRAEMNMPWLRAPPKPTPEGSNHCSCIDPDLRWELDSLICQYCGVSKFHLDQSTDNLAWVSEEEFVPIRMPRRYAPASRFKSLLATFLNNCTSRVGPVQEARIRAWLAQKGVSMEACCGADIRRALRALKEPDLYPSVPGIVAQLRGDPPLQVSKEQELAAACIFEHVIASNERTNRRYFVSYRMMIIDILEEVGVSHVRVYCAELTHRRSKVRAMQDARTLISKATSS